MQSPCWSMVDGVACTIAMACLARPCSATGRVSLIHASGRITFTFTFLYWPDPDSFPPGRSYPLASAPWLQQPSWQQQFCMPLCPSCRPTNGKMTYWYCQAPTDADAQQQCPSLQPLGWGRVRCCVGQSCLQITLLPLLTPTGVVLSFLGKGEPQPPRSIASNCSLLSRPWPIPPHSISHLASAPGFSSYPPMRMPSGCPSWGMVMSRDTANMARAKSSRRAALRSSKTGWSSRTPASMVKVRQMNVT